MRFAQHQDELDVVSSVEPVFNGYQFEGSTWRSDVRRRWSCDVNAFIGYELKLVPEVEHVFVSREDEEGHVLRVTIVVDARDSAVRSTIYDREQAIIDELKSFEFDFHIVAREGRSLDALITDAGAGDSAL